MREALLGYNRVLREKELLRQDDQFVKKLRAVTSTIDNKVPRSMSMGRRGKKQQLVIEKQDEIGKHNLLLLKKLKLIDSRPNKSMRL
jgi:hypothetical protein